jgi:5,10-methylenetetrahydrofolate reductase
VLLEITPPRRARREILLRRAGLLGEAADAIEVIQRSDRITSLDAAAEVRRSGRAVVWNLVNRGRTRREIAADLERARSEGLDTMLCVRGDHAADDLEETPKLFEVVRMARDVLPSACVGATLNQYASRDRVVRNLVGKLAAGARFVQTQPVFDLEHLTGVARFLKGEWPEVWIVPMVIPLVFPDEAERIRARLGISLAEPWVERLSGPGGQDAGWTAFAELVEALRQSPLVDGIAVMTPRMDPPEAFCERLSSVLGRAPR